MEKIIFVSDIKGIGLRKKLLEYSSRLNLFTEDIGIFEGSPLDFVDMTKQMALKLSSPNIHGVLICDNGHGIAMAANKYNYIRAALCNSKEDAEAVRRKLNANVLCLENKNLSINRAKSCLNTFIHTPFKTIKYKKSIEKIKAIATVHSDQGINLIVRGVIICNGHILLSTATQHNKEFAKDLYFLPGGHVDYNESAISALKREILEEMSLQAKELKFIGALECNWNKKGSLYHEINLVYHVNIPNLSLNTSLQSSEPFIKFVWCPLSAISNYHILPEQLGVMLQEMDRNVDTKLFYSQMIKIF